MNDHVFSMIEDLDNFSGVFPGNSNLANLGNINTVGKKFVQHSGPIKTWRPVDSRQGRPEGRFVK